LLLTIKGILLTILAFGLMVFIHELGHFLAAKLIGVRVERFSFGMPPKLIGRKWGDTEYVISALPIGGYVKLAGGDEGEEATGAPDEFVSKPPSQRALVLAAGPIFSILFGIPTAMGMLFIGRDIPFAKVSEVVIGGPAWKAGLHYGDRITRVAGQEVATFDELRQTAAETAPDDPFDIVVQRGQQKLTLSVRRPRGERLGISCAFHSMQIAEVTEDSPAAAAGLQPGDVVVRVDGRRARGWMDFRRHLLANPDRTVRLDIERNGKPSTLEATLKTITRADPGFRVRLPLEIGFVRQGFPAQGKLEVGDRVVSVNGKFVDGWWDVEDAVAEGPETAAITVQRRGKPLTVELRRGAGLRAADTLGIVPRPTLIVASVHGEAEPPLRVGDEIVKVGRQDVAKAIAAYALYMPPDDLLMDLARAGSLTVRRGTTELTVELEPGKRFVGRLGVRPKAAAEFRQESFFGSIVPALKKTTSMGKFAFVILGKLLSGDVSIRDLTGPVGIVQHTYLSARRGWPDLFYLVHLLTVNIGVLNLLPIPPLDGGHLVLLGYEKVRGKEKSRRLREALLVAGLALVLLLILVVTFNDVWRLVF